MGGVLSGTAVTAYTAMTLDAAVTPLTGPAGKAVIAVVGLTGIIGGGYLGAKIMGGGARKLLGVNSENRQKEPGFFTSALNAFKS